MSSCFSLISLYKGYLRYFLSSNGLSSQTIDIDNETTMHFWGPKPKQDSPSTPTTVSKPPLILIHGFGPAGVWQWRPQVSFFSRDYDLYIPDLAFFGLSTSKSNERSQVFQAVCVAKLLEKIGLSKYSVVGTSYGGFVAYQLASMWPERVDKVVIASSAVNRRKKDGEDLLRKVGVKRIEELMLPESPGQLRTLIGLAVYKRPYAMPDFILNDIIHNLYLDNRKEKLELLYGMTIGKEDTVDISPLRQEVLIIWGEHDQIFPSQRASELKELLGKKAKMEVMKNTSHVPHIEKASEFNALVSNFLKGTL